MNASVTDYLYFSETQISSQAQDTLLRERRKPGRALQNFYGQAVAGGGGLMLIELICSCSHHVILWGPGQGSHCGAECWGGPALDSWQWVLDVGWWLPSQGSRTKSSLQCLRETEICFPLVPPANPARQEPLLFIAPNCSLCRDEPSTRTQQSWHSKVLHGFVHGKGYIFRFFLSLPVAEPVLCDAYASSASPRLSASQGRELPKEALQPWDLGSWRSHCWETWALL